MNEANRIIVRSLKEVAATIGNGVGVLFIAAAGIIVIGSLIGVSVFAFLWLYSLAGAIVAVVSTILLFTLLYYLGKWFDP